MSQSGSCGKMLQESPPMNNVNALNRVRSDVGTDCKEEILEELFSATDSELGTDNAENEGFFNMVSHAQRNRMDDQRCDLGQNETPSKKSIIDTNKTNCERPINELLDMLADKQGQRLDDQRVTCDNLPGLQLSECCLQPADEGKNEFPNFTSRYFMMYITTGWSENSGTQRDRGRISKWGSDSSLDLTKIPLT